MPRSKRYSFGLYILDTGRGVLWRSGERVAIKPRTLDLLTALVERSGEVLEKDDLLRRVWAGANVDENNLARQVSSLRRVLGETSGQREYVATITGIGYRFVAPVVALDCREVGEAPPVIVPDVPPAQSPGDSREPWDSRPTLAIVGVLLLLAAGVTSFLATREKGRLDGSSLERSVHQVTFGGGLQQDPAWSPDGRRIAFASDQFGTLDLYVQDTGAAEPVRLTSLPGREWQPAWSPDGKWLAFRSDQDGGGLFIMPAGGGPARRLSTFGDRPQWSPAGSLILFSSATVRTGARSLFVVSPAGGSPREVCADAIRPFIASQWFDSVEAAWHPDGRRVSILGRVDGRWAFATAPIDGGPPAYSSFPPEIVRQLEESQLELGGFTWAPSADALFLEGQSGDTRNIWRAMVSRSTMAWAGTLKRLTLGVGQETGIALSPDGTRLAFSAPSRQTRVWALDFDPHEARVIGPGRALTAGTAGRLGVDASPDGSRLAYRSRQAGRNEVREYITENRRDRVLLAASSAGASSPRWSVDGRRLAYQRWTLGGRPGLGASKVAVLSTDEGRERLVTLPTDQFLRPSDWSADGRMILGDCRAVTDDTVGICSVPAPEIEDELPALSVLFRDPAKNLYVPRYSPDQRWVSFVAVDVKGSTTSEVYVAPIGGGSWIPMTDGRSFSDKPRWAPDGKVLYFVSDRGGYLNLDARRFDPVAGKPVGGVLSVTSFDSPRRALPSNISDVEFAISPNSLFLPLTETEANIWVLDRVDR